MTEWRLFDSGTVPEWTTPEWYAGREHAPHLEQEGHRDRLLLTAEMIEDALRRNPAGTSAVCDLGAGDGGLLSLLSTKNRWGYDLQQTNVDGATARGERVELRDVTQIPVPCDYARDLYGVNVLVATELLEHLVDPSGFLKLLRSANCNSPIDGRYLVVSSPYTETADDHYEFHTWAWDLNGYRKLLESTGWRVLRQETAWISQVVLASADL